MMVQSYGVFCFKDEFQVLTLEPECPLSRMYRPYRAFVFSAITQVFASLQPVLVQGGVSPLMF